MPRCACDGHGKLRLRSCFHVCQGDGRAWLEKYGCKVEYHAVQTLDHYENSHEEHALVRKAIVAAFQRCRKIESPKKALARRAPTGALGEAIGEAPKRGI